MILLLVIASPIILALALYGMVAGLEYLGILPSTPQEVIDYRVQRFLSRESVLGVDFDSGIRASLLFVTPGDDEPDIMLEDCYHA